MSESPPSRVNSPSTRVVGSLRCTSWRMAKFEKTRLGKKGVKALGLSDGTKPEMLKSLVERFAPRKRKRAPAAEDMGPPPSQAARAC